MSHDAIRTHLKKNMLLCVQKLFSVNIYEKWLIAVTCREMAGVHIRKDIVIFFFFFCLLGPHPWHIEVLRVGVESEL